jgi:PPK2 family polyphosphate:nucleotide phosphotransferase
MQDLSRATRVSPGSKVDLAAHPPDAKLGLRNGDAAAAHTAKRAARMAELATMLMAEHRRALLVVLQGMDASGKDGTVKHCLGGLNPMSVRVAGFKAPNSTELEHDFLWRISQVLPQRGEIGIFNRSHYEDVLVVRVEELAPKQVWKKRYAAINAFEQHLANEGTTVVKLFLNISEEEQAKRFRDRMSDRTKNWKFSADDLTKRTKWVEYMAAYRAVLERTSSKTAPWHIVPADHKWVRDAVVLDVVTQTLEAMAPKWPELSPELKALVIPDS